MNDYDGIDQSEVVNEAPASEVIAMLEESDTDVAFPARGSQGRKEQRMTGDKTDPNDYGDSDILVYDNPVDRAAERYGIDKIE